MTEHKYATLWELFLAVIARAKNNKCEIIHSDNPPSLLIRWGCPATDHYFAVRLSDCRTRKALHVPGQQAFDQRTEKAEDVITKLVVTIEGRKQLAMLLNIGFSTPNEMLHAYDRICKLKVFW